LNRLGLYQPQPEIAANKNNPRGYGEPEWAVKFHQKLLRQAGVKLEDARPSAWELTSRVAEKAAARAELRAWLEEQLTYSNRVVIKDPHLSWFTDLYRWTAEDMSLHLAVVSMLRHPVETTKSRELAYGGPNSAATRLATWVNVMLHVESHTRGLPRAVVAYDDLLSDWRSALSVADESLELQLFEHASPEQVAEADELIDPTLKRASGDWGDLHVPSYLQEIAQQTWLGLQGLIGTSPASQPVEALDQLRSAYADLYDGAEAIARSSIRAARAEGRRQAAAHTREVQKEHSAEVASTLTAATGRAKRVARRAAARAKRTASARLSGGRSEGESSDGKLPVFFLVWDIDEAGGVARSVSTLANGLAEGRRVEIISRYRTRGKHRFNISDKVSVRYLEDRRGTAPSGVVATDVVPGEPSSEDGGAVTPSRRLPKGALKPEDTDARLREALGGLPPGILVSNRPSLHVAAAYHSPAHVIKVATEHSSLSMRGPVVRSALEQLASRIDALVTLTESDQASMANLLNGSGTLLETIPNALPVNVVGNGAPAESTTIVAAGSLVANKGFDRLIAAFAPVAKEFPDWSLHIYGRGGERPALTEQIASLGLQDQVDLKGFDPNFVDRLSDAALLAMSSHYESFGMVLIEAMGSGVPVIAFDCPTGPRHLIDNERTGLLIPDGDIDAYSEGLRRLMSQADLRREIGQEALRRLQHYSLDGVVDQWERMFTQLETARV
jgi:glycosyltransferase involved in cell wall biosynthesis